MAKGFEYDLGNGAMDPLAKPFIFLFSHMLEAEAEDDSDALNNVTWTAQILATMTLEKTDGDCVNSLQGLILQVCGLIQQASDIEIAEMPNGDDEKVEIIRENARYIASLCTRAVNRHILKILCKSYSNGPMRGCTVTAKSGLAFVAENEYDNAFKFVISVLESYGLHDVVDSLESESDTISRKVSNPVNYRPKFMAVRRKMPTEDLQ